MVSGLDAKFYVLNKWGGFIRGACKVWRVNFKYGTPYEFISEGLNKKRKKERVAKFIFLKGDFGVLAIWWKLRVDLVDDVPAWLGYLSSSV